MAFDPFTFASGGGGLGFSTQKDIRADSSVAGGNISVNFGNSGGKGNSVSPGSGECMVCTAVRAGLIGLTIVGVAWGVKKVLR